jgi:glycerol-3-phosphate dehydrogenase (NAD(P)+)
MTRIGVIGAGAWGSVVANILADNGHDVCLWCYKESIAQTIANHQTHHRLPGIQLSKQITTTTQLSDGYDVDLLVLGLSSSQLIAYENDIDWGQINAPILVLAKGIIEPQWFISDWLKQKFSGEIAVLSGPNLALEIAKRKPSASVVAATNPLVASDIQALLSNHYFRVYTSNDVRGVQCGGIFKNVFAIAAGCIDGLALGDNAKSALITRGMVELKRLFSFFGAKESTVWGLSGLGDLIATCSSRHSRNWQLGYTVVTNPDRDTWESVNRGQTEGLRTIRLMSDMLVNESLNLPIIRSVGRLFLTDQVSPQEIIQDLMERGLKSEFDQLV